jgi:hypothetical protein
MSEFESRPADRTAFAEVAEALGVTTRDVMASYALPGHDTTVAVFSVEGGEWLYSAVLRRDDDEILRMVIGPIRKMTIAEFGERLGVVV